LITVIVDRESVAADDVGAHASTWTFDDDARIGDVVTRMVDEAYLPAVSDSGWRISLVAAARVHRDEGRARHVDVSPGGSRPVAMLLTGELPSKPNVLPLDGWVTPRTHLTETGVRLPSGEYAVFAGHVGPVGPLAWPEFSEWVAESDEVESHRAGVTLHARYPDLFDAEGNVRDL
jgi:hypothetical protein